MATKKAEIPEVFLTAGEGEFELGLDGAIAAAHGSLRPTPLSQCARPTLVPWMHAGRRGGVSPRRPLDAGGRDKFLTRSGIYVLVMFDPYWPPEGWRGQPGMRRGGWRLAATIRLAFFCAGSRHELCWLRRWSSELASSVERVGGCSPMGGGGGAPRGRLGSCAGLGLSPQLFEKARNGLGNWLRRQVFPPRRPSKRRPKTCPR